MNILIVKNNSAEVKSISLSSLVLFPIIIFLLLGWAYYYLNPISKSIATTMDLQPEDIIQIIHKEQKKIKYLQTSIDQQIDNFVLKLAQVQSQLIQLDNVGEKLVKVSRLNTKEFNFNQLSSMGGPELTTESSSSNIEQRLSEIKNELSFKSQQLYALEALLDDKLYREQVTPRGKPAKNGWISSYFGKRKDPFSGKTSQHHGIDLAGKTNTHVLATARGLVSWARKRSGYGNLVEISHGNGLVTRYGHCKEILVKEGQKINQGDIIATIGSTGRSTGPHVHYEVIKDGVKINPISYVRKKEV